MKLTKFNLIAPCLFNHPMMGYGFGVQPDVFDIQAFFRYESDFMFFGDNPGTHITLNDFMSTTGYNPFALNKPIVGVLNERATYIGLAY